MRLPRSRTCIMEHPRESTVASVPTANARDSIGRSLDRVVRSSVRPSVLARLALARRPARPLAHFAPFAPSISSRVVFTLPYPPSPIAFSTRDQISPNPCFHASPLARASVFSLDRSSLGGTTDAIFERMRFSNGCDFRCVPSRTIGESGPIKKHTHNFFRRPKPSGSYLFDADRKSRSREGPRRSRSRSRDGVSIDRAVDDDDESRSVNAQNTGLSLPVCEYKVAPF